MSIVVSIVGRHIFSRSASNAPRSRRLRPVAVTAAVAIAAVPAVALAAPSAAAAPPTQQTFAFAGAKQTFVVPPAVTKIFITAIGGAGGNGGGEPGHPGGAGGAAGSVSAALPVTPGQTLSVYTGYFGADAGGGGLSGGFRLSGRLIYGGSGGGGGQTQGTGGGGGGATLVTDGTTPLLVAGGGGGGGGANVVASGGTGGAGGNPAGNGATGDGTAGGPGGAGALPGGDIAGQNGQNNQAVNGSGGGGGAGWVIPGGSITGGGGGGRSSDPNHGGTGGGGGGGGGASSAAAGATNVRFATATQRGAGSVFINWDQPATTTRLAVSGSQLAGEPITLTATIAPATPAPGDPPATGTVTFLEGNTLIGTASLGTGVDSNKATLALLKLPAGTHNITANYYGDTVYAGSVSDPLAVQVVSPPFFTSPASVAGFVGTPLNFTIRTGGYPPPLLFASGNFGGLTFTDNRDGTARLAGTPKAAGSFAITVMTVEIAFGPVTQHLTLNVTVKPLSITTTTLAPAFVGQAFSATLAGTGGIPPFTWSLAAGSLPKGLTLNASTGVISGVPTTAGTTSFTVKVTDSSSPTKRTATRALTITSTGIVPAVYATNGANNTVTSYPLSGGNVAPSTRLAGLAQGLNGPSGVVLNAAGRLFVANGGSDSIAEYDRGSSTPTVLSGPHTGLSSPAGLTLDGTGRLYVANRTANTITEYAAGASGDATPVATIAGPVTGLSAPAAVTIDSAGRLWVANSGNNSLTAYVQGVSGNTGPVAKIAGSATGLNDPQGLSQDAAGNLLVANTYGESVTAYATTATGNAFPLRTISGSSTGLSFPTGIDIDTAGRIYVANQFDNDITVYAATATGNAVPVTTIAGSNTGLAAPYAIAVTPPLSVQTTKLPSGRVGHAYLAALSAGQGTSPYRWHVLRGSLPPGLSLSRTGLISGRPCRPGIWSVTLRVTDSGHPATTADARLTLTVRAR